VSERIVDEQFVRELEEKRSRRRNLDELFERLDNLCFKSEKEILRSPRGRLVTGLKRFLFRLIQPALAPFLGHQKEMERARLELLREIRSEADERLAALEENLLRAYIKAGESSATLRADTLRGLDNKLASLEAEIAGRVLESGREAEKRRAEEAAAEMRRLGNDLVARTDMLVGYLEDQVEALGHDLERHVKSGEESIGSCVERLDEFGKSLETLRGRALLLAREMETAGLTPKRVSVGEEEALSGADYLAHQDRFRGGSEEIAGRQRLYLDYLREAEPVLDVGCGRGEFLEILKSEGISAYGIDFNPAMVRLCRGKGLEVKEADLFKHLKSVKEGSLGGIFAAQVVEHLTGSLIRAFLSECRRVLKPGGVLIAETINPESVYALTRYYFLDADHRSPLPPELLRFLAELAGFAGVEVKMISEMPEGERLQPVRAEAVLPAALETAFNRLNRNIGLLNRFLFGHLEYAVIARK
jgi:SAM-dependent methyltransferase